MDPGGKISNREYCLKRLGFILGQDPNDPQNPLDMV